METWNLQPGSLVKIKNCDLPNGKPVKLEPQSVDFLEILDPEAVLENALRKFSTLTSICVIETDLETDFAPPVGYVEPEYKPEASSSSSNPINPSMVNRSAGAGSMAHTMGNADIVCEGNKKQVFKGTGQKVSGKEIVQETKNRMTIDDLDPDAAPVEFNMPGNQIQNILHSLPVLANSEVQFQDKPLCRHCNCIRSGHVTASKRPWDSASPLCSSDV